MRPGVQEHLPLRGRGRHDPHRHRHLPDVVVEQGHRLPDHEVAQRLPRVVLADPREILAMDAVVGIEIGKEDLAQVVAFLGQDAHHPAPAPVHGRRLADDDPRLERILDVIEAPELVAELLLEPSHVDPTRLVRLAGDDPDHLLVGRVVGVDDRLHRLLEHVVRLGVGRDDAQVDVLERVAKALHLVPVAQRQPVLSHVATHPRQRAVDPCHDGHRAQQPIDVEQQDDARHHESAGPRKDDRNPGRRQEQDPGNEPRRRLEEAGSELVQRLVQGGRGPGGWG